MIFQIIACFLDYLAKGIPELKHLLLVLTYNGRIHAMIVKQPGISRSIIGPLHRHQILAHRTPINIRRLNHQLLRRLLIRCHAWLPSALEFFSLLESLIATILVLTAIIHLV